MPSHLISELARRVSRPPRETEALASPRMLRRRWLAFLAFAGLVGVPFVVSGSRAIDRWVAMRAVSELPKADWLLYYPDSPTEASCGSGSSAPSECPANPTSPSLFGSTIRRGDVREHARVVEGRGLREYWLGTTLSPELARKAAESEANVLIVGNLKCTYAVWVDGKRVLSGSWQGDAEPLALPLPLDWLARRDRPLPIAIRCQPEHGVGRVGLDVPDYLESPPLLGFATKRVATAWRKYQFLWLSGRPLAFLLVNFALAWVFIGLWRIAPEKTEYFYIALFALSFSLMQLRQLELFYTAVSRETVTEVGLLSFILLAFTGAWVGFAFARLRSAFIGATAVACIACCASVFLLDVYEQQRWGSFWATQLVPAGLLLGALACLLQAVHLRLTPAGPVSLSGRIRRLAFFGAGLGVLVALNRFNLYADTPSGMQLVFGRSGPFFLLLSLGLVAISEYRSEHNLARSMPISKFHQRAPLPDRVPGAILHVDIKGAEKLLRLGAQLGRGGELTETCLSQLWTCVTECQGVVLHTEGDALLALFAAEDAPEPVAAAFRAADLMAESLAQVARRFEQQGLGAALGEGGLVFRGSIVEGAIRPIWQDYGGSKLAGWVEAGSTNALVESARLLELEKALDPALTRGRCMIVAPLELRGRQGASGGAWVVERARLAGKHGRIYELAAYAPPTQKV